MGLPYMRSIILSILSLFTFYLLLPSNAAHLELSSAQQPIIGSGLPKRLAIIGFYTPFLPQFSTWMNLVSDTNHHDEHA